MPTLWMIGHSDRAFPQFLEMLQAHRIVHLVDIRAYPNSRRHPQFDRLELQHRLPKRGVHYAWMPHLGGMRTPVAGSQVNVAWKEEGFRAYADHMQTAEFAAACNELGEAAATQRTAAMCAEANPLQCHRQLLADAFVARGWEIRHLVDGQTVRTHELTATARIGASGKVHYPGEPTLPF